MLPLGLAEYIDRIKGRMSEGSYRTPNGPFSLLIFLGWGAGGAGVHGQGGRVKRLLSIGV